MVREVRTEEALKFIMKAREFYESALENYQKRRFNASMFDATQCIILANDAFCVFSLGQRPSRDHREAVRLHAQAAGSGENKREILAEALEKRSTFGYTEKETGDQEANTLLIRAKRFLDWVKNKIEKG